jgi:hypothetical protein
MSKMTELASGASVWRGYRCPRLRRRRREAGAELGREQRL